MPAVPDPSLTRAAQAPERSLTAARASGAPSAERQWPVSGGFQSIPMTEHNDHLLRRLIGGDDKATAEIIERATTSTSPELLVAAALLDGEPNVTLSRAASVAVTTRDRQLVAIAGAHLDGDEELLDVLVRDHLADHPDNILAAWIAAHHTRYRRPPGTIERIEHA